MSLRFTNGVFKLKGVQTVRYEVPVSLPTSALVEVPTVAPEPVVVPEPVVEVPVVVPEPVVEAPAPVPEPLVEVVELPVAPSEVEAPAEVTEAPAETGLVPENPPAE
jgi:hypothetical protein